MGNTQEEALAKAKTPSEAILAEAVAEGSLALSISGLRHHFQDVCSMRLKSLGLTPALLYFLLYVGKHPGCTQRQMNDALCVDVGYATRSVAKLVEAGYLEQRANPSDGRSNLLYLTPEGERAYGYGRRVVGEWNDVALGCLEPEEAETLNALLGKVAMHLGALNEYMRAVGQ